MNIQRNAARRSNNKHNLKSLRGNAKIKGIENRSSNDFISNRVKHVQQNHNIQTDDLLSANLEASLSLLHC